MDLFNKLKFHTELHLVRPVSSYIGFLKLKKISLKQDHTIWGKSFHNKKVLIVGTGPSLDKVTPDYFLKFDAIIYINHAVKLAGKIEEEYYFSTDTYVTKDVTQKSYFENIVTLGSNRSILAPIHFQSSQTLDEDFVKLFSLISASRAYYKPNKPNNKIMRFVYRRFIYWPVQPNSNELKIWLSQKDQVTYFPIIESTSALSAILFAGKYYPKSINLIGCDFSVGRAGEVVKDNPSKNFNPFNKSKEKFLFLKKYFTDKNIKLRNDSWDIPV